MQIIDVPKNNMLGLCVNAWLPWKPIRPFSKMGCTNEINNILAYTCHKQLSMVSTKGLDMCLSYHGK